MARYKSRSITIECEGEAYIDDFDTEVLVEELKRRKQEVETKSEIEGLVEVHDLLASGRYDEATWMLEKIIWPKWKSVEQCKEKLAELRPSS